MSLTKIRWWRLLAVICGRHLDDRQCIVWIWIWHCTIRFHYVACARNFIYSTRASSHDFHLLTLGFFSRIWHFRPCSHNSVPSASVGPKIVKKLIQCCRSTWSSSGGTIFDDPPNWECDYLTEVRIPITLLLTSWKYLFFEPLGPFSCAYHDPLLWPMV